MSATMEAGPGVGVRPEAGAPGRGGARARLGRYARWQLADFMRERGVWIAALGLMMLWLFRATYDSSAPVRAAELARRTGIDWSVRSEAEHFRQQIARVVAMGTFVATLIATHGIVSRDRERGYQRFLFAKPVSVARFYLQSFVVNGAGLLLIVAALLGTAAVAFGRTLPVLPLLGYAAAQYVMLGGLVMLLSTVVRYDFALATLVAGASMPIQAYAWMSRGGGPLVKVLSIFLPPVLALGDALLALVAGTSVAGPLVGPLCYGAICVAAALHVLRRRSISL